MKKLILAICLAFLCIGAYANKSVNEVKKNNRTVKFLNEVAFVRLKSECGVSWSCYMHYDSSLLPSIEIANYVNRMKEMQDAIDAACGTNKTTVYF